MENLFIRSKHNPILKPDSGNWWEAKKLYNPGAIYHNNQYHLFYRAVGSGEGWKSSIGYAVSNDGENFERFNEPLLTAENEYEKRGLEDPRITKLGDAFHMVYSGYDGITPRLCTATSDDLKIWDKTGPALSGWELEKSGGVRINFKNGKPVAKPMPHEWSKSGGIFQEKINNKYLMMFGKYRIWFAESEDGINWTGENTPFLGPRPGAFFDNTFVEMGPPPIKTDKGWLVLYHGINKKYYYRIGILLLDLGSPKKILYRSEQPIFYPSKPYEISGMVDVIEGGLIKLQSLSEQELKKYLKEQKGKGMMPRVTFCCGATLVKDELRIFYGASDSVICTATANINNILNLI